TTRRSVTDFLAQFDFSPLQQHFNIDFLSPEQRLIIVGGGAVSRPAENLLIYDANLQPRLEFTFDPQPGYAVNERGEYPSQGLQLIRVWEPTGKGFADRDVRPDNIWIRPRETTGTGESAGWVAKPPES